MQIPEAVLENLDVVKTQETVTETPKKTRKRKPKAKAVIREPTAQECKEIFGIEESTDDLQVDDLFGEVHQHEYTIHPEEPVVISPLEVIEIVGKGEPEETTEPEEIENVEESDNYVPDEPTKITNSGKLFLIYAETQDHCVGLQTNNTKKRCPFINFSYYFSVCASRTKNPNKILVLGTNSYKELLARKEIVAGVQLAVITTQDGLVRDPSVVRFSDMKILQQHIDAAKAIGADVLINTGAEILDYFSTEADGEFILTTYQDSKEVLRPSETGIFYINQRQPLQQVVLSDGIPIRNVSRKPCRVVYNQF